MPRSEHNRDLKVIAIWRSLLRRPIRPPVRVQDRSGPRAPALGQVRHQRSGGGLCAAGLRHPALDGTDSW